MKAKALIALMTCTYLACGMVVFSTWRYAQAQERRAVRSIQTVLEADTTAAAWARASSGTGAMDLSEFCERISRVPSDGCPEDFRTAWRDYCMAWEKMKSLQSAKAGPRTLAAVGASWALQTPAPLLELYSESARADNNMSRASADVDLCRRRVILTAARYGIVAPPEF